MKRARIISAAMMMLLLFMLSGCKKTDDLTTVLDVVSDDDIANSLAGALGDNQTAYGFTSTAELAAKLFRENSASVPPKVSVDSTFTVTKTSALYTYSYTMRLMTNLVGLGESLNFTMNGKGNFDTQQTATTDSATTGLTVRYLLGNVKDYFITGTHKRIGLTGLKRSSLLSYNSTTNMLFDSVIVDKDSLTLKKGKADLTYAYNVAGINTTISAQVTYLNNKTALLVFNGKTYTLDLTKASATKK